MSHSRLLRDELEKHLWKAGLTPLRLPEHRQLLRVQDYPNWLIRCYQTRRWYLWELFDDALAESPEPSSYFSLITVDRRDDSAVATFEFGLLRAWSMGQAPLVIPRRKRRLGFAHHRQLNELHHEGIVPLLASCQEDKPILISVPLEVFKAWLQQFPAPKHEAQRQGRQLTLSLWTPS